MYMTIIFQENKHDKGVKKFEYLFQKLKNSILFGSMEILN